VGTSSRAEFFKILYLFCICVQILQICKVPVSRASSAAAIAISRNSMRSASRGNCYSKCYCVASVTKAYTLSIVQHLTDADMVVRKDLSMQMFYLILDDEIFLDSVNFSDEGRFQVSTAGSGAAKIHLSPGTCS
jgi:hypothetical protein